jgi:signal transduction histidine kinase
MDRVSDFRTSKWVVVASGATLALSALAVVLLPRTLTGFWSSSSFLPHVYCYLYDKQLVTLHLICDTAIWISYVAIAITFTYLVYRTRRDIPFGWMFLAFGTFIITCGFTHFMEVVVLWRPLYWLSGDIKLVTAVASVLTAVALPSPVPQAEAMVASARISEQRRAQLEKSNTGLATREAELSHSNSSLQREIANRQQAEDTLRVLSSRLLTLQDDERQRISHALHEGTAQDLTALQLSFDELRRNLSTPVDLALLSQSEDLIENILNEVRTTSYLLHPPLLEEAGLASALRWYGDTFSRMTGIEIAISLPEDVTRLPSETEIGLFRIVQESLTNVRLHAHATHAAVQMLQTESSLTLTISDNGIGLPLESAPLDRKGIGIPGIKERARQLHGTLEIVPLNPGTMVRVTIPL